MIWASVSKLTTVDNRNGHENASSTAQGPHQVGGNGEETKNSAASERSRWNCVLEFPVYAALTMTRDNLPRDTLY
jgi:hypothetical protein